jgi:glutathione S-transferase
MLVRRRFLVGERPRFVDFDLYGMLANFLYSSHYKLPARHTRLKEWYARMTTLKSTRLQ